MDCLVFLFEEQRLVDGGMVDQYFIDAMSSIVNHGCEALSFYQPGPVDGAGEHATNFRSALQ